VVDEHDLRRHFRLNTAVEGAEWDEGTHTYTVSHNGVVTSLTAQVSFSQDKKGTPAC